MTYYSIQPRIATNGIQVFDLVHRLRPDKNETFWSYGVAKWYGEMIDSTITMRAHRTGRPVAECAFAS